MPVPQVSIVMAAYNAAGFLDDSISSLLRQSFADFELIVIDDGSTDATPNILSRVKDARLRVLRNGENQGLTLSLNRGLAEAQAPFVARQDADDLSHPLRLEKQLRFVAERGVDICFCRARYIGPDGLAGKEWREMPTKLALWRNLFSNYYGPHPAVLFRKDAILEIGGYDPVYSCGQDYDLWDRATQAELSFGYLPEVLLDYRSHEGAISSRRHRDQFETGRLVSERALRRNFPGIGQDEISALRWLMFERAEMPSAQTLSASLDRLWRRLEDFSERRIGRDDGAFWQDVARRLSQRLIQLNSDSRAKAALLAIKSALRSQSPKCIAYSLWKFSSASFGTHETPAA